MKPFNLEEYLANPTKKVVTRKGLSVRILATDLEDSDFPIAAAIGNRYPLAYTSRGTRNYELWHEDDNDLFFATEKREGWVNVYMNCNERYLGTLYSSKEDALEVTKANDNYVATVKIEWEE